LSRRPADAFLRVASITSVALAGLILVAVVGVIVAGALPGLRTFGPWGFLGSAIWHPSSGQVGALAMVVGTIGVTGLALLIAVPLGGLTGLASGWLLPRGLAGLLRLVVMLASGLPSIVVGLWGLTAVVPILAQWHPPGASLLAAGLVLAMMTVPTVALIVDSALRTIDQQQRQATAALGLSSWGALAAVGLPTLRGGLLTGGVLATTRALGETMAVLLVAGNVVQVPGSIFDPVRTLTAGIALEMAYATGDHRAALFVLGLIALMVVMALLLTLRWLVRDDGTGAGYV